MYSTLYLDTARFGRMRIRARRAAADHARLCSDEGGSRRVEELLVGGHESWPQAFQLRYPGLADWGGLASLRSDLRTMLGAPTEADVLLAARSATLMRIGARALARRCRRILHTDLEWGAYLGVLREEARRAGREVISLPVRHLVGGGTMGAEDIARLVADAYRARSCEGLFLTDISYDGMRIPVTSIVRELERGGAEPLLVVDGSQAVGQAPVQLDGCDLYLSGAQKWLRAGHPIGIALVPREKSRALVAGEVAGLLATGCVADPLLDLVDQIDSTLSHPYGETADLGAIFCLAAAVRAECAERRSTDQRFALRKANAASVREIARRIGWEPVEPSSALRTGIVLLRAADPGVRSWPAERLRSELHRRGLAATAYDGGVVRLSMPGELWEEEDLEVMRSVLAGVVRGMPASVARRAGHAGRWSTLEPRGLLEGARRVQ